MKNRIRKLESDQHKLNHSLILISSKSQKMLNCKKFKDDVLLSYLQNLKELKKLREKQKLEQIQKAEKFTQDRLNRIHKRQQTQNEIKNKNRSIAQNMKKNLAKEIKETKKIEAKIKVQKMEKKTFEEMLKVLFARPNITRKKSQTSIKERLINEKQSTQRNIQMLKSLSMKENNLMEELSKTARISLEVANKCNMEYLVSSSLKSYQ